MGVFSVKLPVDPQPTGVIHVVCGACNSGADVTSRRQFAAFEEGHLSGCGSSWVSLDPPMSNVLDLPPY
jgi:hypothetical protein